jgi:hypothetical protein
MNALEKLKEITFDLTQAECPCGECMGEGCGACDELGADIISLRSIRTAFAKALTVVAGLEEFEVMALAQELRD